MPSVSTVSAAVARLIMARSRAKSRKHAVLMVRRSASLVAIIRKSFAVRASLARIRRNRLSVVRIMLHIVRVLALSAWNFVSRHFIRLLLLMARLLILSFIKRRLAMLQSPVKN